MKTTIYTIYRSTLLMLLGLFGFVELHAGEATVSDAKAEVLYHDDGVEYVKITYTATDIPTSGILLGMDALCTQTSDPTKVINVSPYSQELSGDIGQVGTSGQKTIYWEAEQSLVRIGAQEKYGCIITLKIKSTDTNTVTVTLDLRKYSSSPWYYFKTGLAKMNLIRTAQAKATFSCSNVMGLNWHKEAEDAGATFYQVTSVTQFPEYNGRSSADQYHGLCTIDGCSSFLAIKDQGKPTQKIWALFAKQFQQSQKINGTDIVQFFEFQFRATETKDGVQVSVGNAGKPPSQQLYSELNTATDCSLTISNGLESTTQTPSFELEVPRREWKYKEGTKHLWTIAIEGKKAKFVGSAAGRISLDKESKIHIGNTIVIDASKLDIDTIANKVALHVEGAATLGSLKLPSSISSFDLNAQGSTLTLRDPVLIEGANLYVAKFAFLLNALTLSGDPSTTQDLSFSTTLKNDIFQKGCGASPDPNNVGIQCSGMQYTGNEWSFPTKLRLDKHSLAHHTDWCLKDLELNYDSKADIIRLDGSCSAPMFDNVSASLQLQEKHLQNVRLTATLANNAAVPIPQNSPAMVFKALDFDVHDLDQPFPWWQGSATFQNTTLWKESEQYAVLKPLQSLLEHHTIFELECSGVLRTSEQESDIAMTTLRFLGLNSSWFAQASGHFSMTLGSNQVAFSALSSGVHIDVGGFGGSSYMLQGTMYGMMSTVPSYVFSARVVGDLTIPDLFKTTPFFQTFNSKLHLPYHVGEVQAAMYNTTLSFSATLGWLGEFSVWLDGAELSNGHFSNAIGLTKGSTKKLGSIACPSARNTIQAVDTLRTSFTVDKATRNVYVQYAYSSSARTQLSDPKGTVYTSTSLDSSVIFSPAVDANDINLWVLRNPMKGSWTCAMINGTPSDSLTIWSTQTPYSAFNITSSQSAKTVRCSWDTSGISASTSMLDLFLATDTISHSGTLIARVAASQGYYSYTLSDSLSACGYYIMASLHDKDFNWPVCYSPTYHSNPKSILAAPTNIQAIYHLNNSVHISWTKVQDPMVHHIDVIGKRSNGTDSVYAALVPTEGSVDFVDAHPELTRYRLQCVAANGWLGCASEATSAVLGLDAEATSLPVGCSIYPNPTEGRCRVVFSSDLSSALQLEVFSVLAQSVFKTSVSQGQHSIELDLSSLPAGVYVLRATDEDLHQYNASLLRR